MRHGKVEGGYGRLPSEGAESARPREIPGVRAYYCSVIPAGRDWRQAYTRGAPVARLVSGPIRPSKLIPPEPLQVELNSLNDRTRRMRKHFLIVISALLCMYAQPGPADESARAQMKGLDEQVQEVKSDVLSIAADLNQLEEKLLYPSDT